MDPKKLFPEIDPKALFPEIDPEELLNQGPNEIPIGTDVDSQGRATLDLGLIDTHLHVIGLTGVGKSSFLEIMCRLLIDRRQGLTVIDPHGFLYDAMVAYLGYYPELADKVVLFNPVDQKSQLVGFNPMARVAYYNDLRKQIDVNTSGIAKVWGEDSKSTPQLRRYLTNAFFPIIESGYTILEAEYFTWLDESGPRKFLASKTTKTRVRREWEAFERFSINRQSELLGSMLNRMPEFTDNEMVRLTMGQTRNVLDFEDIFENQKVLLVNLSRRGALSRDNADMIGVFLINELFNYAISRSQRAGKEQPMYLVIDEFQNFLSPDTAAVIDECRKFGLHMILSHQRLQQLKEKGDEIYYAVKDGARNKLIFSISYNDAQLLVDDVYAGEISLTEVKQEIYGSTVYNFREETRLIESYGHSSGRVDSTSSAAGGASGSGAGAGAGTTYGPDGLIFGGTQVGSIDTASQFESLVESWSEGRGHAEINSDTSSTTEVPIVIPEIRQELKSRQWWNLEEQRYKKVVGLVTQPIQHAVLLLKGQLKRIKIQTLLPYPEDSKRISNAEQISQEKQQRYYLPLDTRQADIKERQDKIEQATEPEGTVKIISTKPGKQRK